MNQTALQTVSFSRYSLWRLTSSVLSLTLVLLFLGDAFADQKLLVTHCSKCHGVEKPKGDFHLRELGEQVTSNNIDFWTNSLDYVKSGEMPPSKQSRLTDADRQRLVAFLRQQLHRFGKQERKSRTQKPRRLNNRELINSVADVLMIEDIGTHQPAANLLGDTLYKGFDTNGDTLGISEFHLEQYIVAIRKILDATILTGERPETGILKVDSADLRVSDRSNRRRQERANRTPTSIEILDLRRHVYFDNFKVVPKSGRYRIKIRAMGVDRNVYDSKHTGFHALDPIRIRVHLGARTRDFDLPDGRIADLVVDEWLAAGTQVEITFLTDALRLVGNGNFKFQYRIAHDYLKANNRRLYRKVVTEEVPKSKGRSNNPAHWSHWTNHWQGPRPRLFGAHVEGPIYESWPPKRHIALLGSDPKAANAERILRPIAARAWRREVREGELKSIVNLVQSRSRSIGDVEAMKEGIVAILVSPSFLLINPEQEDPSGRFATKLSYFFGSTIPDSRTRKLVENGKLRSFVAVRDEVNYRFENGKADEFLNEFPKAWLQLDRINFMAPDPDRFPLYDRKRLSEDMVDEVLHFFRHAVEHNVPVPELLTADYSFVNADLAQVYQVDGVVKDSKLRKHKFTDGRRGGLLGMGAFLTLTADSLGTSPIHRAVYVMENFLDIHPSPPPADVDISEPDVRQAKTIKEILNAHRADTRCASCHQSIDPYGYAFENFDPVGAWRTKYTAHLGQLAKNPRRQDDSGATPIRIDASATFRNGKKYKDIREFRALMQLRVNQERFVRCFVKKLLTYANGTEPDDYIEIEKIVSKSAQHDYRIRETITAVVNSPLFREQ